MEQTINTHKLKRQIEGQVMILKESKQTIRTYRLNRFKEEQVRGSKRK